MLQLLWVVCVRLRVWVRCGWYIVHMHNVIWISLCAKVPRSCVLVCTCVLVWLCVTLPHCSQLTTWQRLRSFQSSSRHLDSNRTRWGVFMLRKETGERLLWAVFLHPYIVSSLLFSPMPIPLLSLSPHPRCLSQWTLTSYLRSHDHWTFSINVDLNLSIT